MTFQNWFDDESLKYVVLGAAGTLLAGGIAWLVSKLFSPKAKVVWTHKGLMVPVTAPEGKRDYVCVHTITVQNVGRGDASNILITIDGPITTPRINRESVGWTLENRELISEDKSFSVSSKDGSDMIAIPKLPAKNVANIVYSGRDGRFTRATSVTVDGIAAIGAHGRFIFLRERDVYIRALKASWWLVIPFLAPILMSLFSRLIEGLHK